jgi:Ca2+-binding EF-hand superfamily protein
MPWHLHTTKIQHLCLALICAGIAMPALSQTQSDYLRSFDRDGDKRVSLLEFQDAMSWAFEQMDKNADGILTPSEQLIPKAKTFTLKEHRDRLAIQFGKQDRNKDGFLSAKELAAPPQM